MIPNLKQKPEGEYKLFFGTQDLARLDKPYDATFKAIAEVDESNTWFLNVIDCSNDTWYNYSESALQKFQLTVGYQTSMDATVPDVFSYLAEIATDPYLSYLYSRISTMEKTHNLSYSSGITQAFGAKAEEFLDVVYTDEHIKHRVDDEVKIAHKFIKAVQNGFSNTKENREILLELLVTIFFLEGIKFPFSFFTTWVLNRAYKNCSQGFSQLLILIANDEMSVHTTTGSNILNKLRKSNDFKKEFKSGWFSKMVKRNILKTVEKEIEWSNYLLESGEEQSFTKNINDHFIKYWANKRLKEIKEPQIYSIKKNDIEDWFDAYRNINGKQSALQEISNISYQLGTCINDLHKFDKEVIDDR